MRKIVVALALGGWLIHAPVAHASAATTPAQVVSASPFYAFDVASTVTMTAPGVITLTTHAYRHPVTVQARVTVAEPGTYVISDNCKPYRLPMTWTVRVDGQPLASSSLKCS